MSNYFYGSIIKIGHTQNRPDVRANDLNRQTGVLGEFVVEWYTEVPNCKIGEKIIHLLFDEFRLAKEFFHADLENSITIMQEKLISVFSDEKVKSHRPPKSILKQKTVKELQIIDILNLSRHTFEKNQPNEFNGHGQEVNDLRYKLLYRPEIYFKEIQKELEEYCLNFNFNQNTSQSDIKETKTSGYVFFQLNNSFSKWFYKQEDIFVREIIIESRVSLNDDSEMNIDNVETGFSILIPSTNFQLSSVYSDGFIEILRKHGISCQYKVSNLDLETDFSILQEQDADDEDTSIWYFKALGKTYNLNKILGGDISDVNLLDDEKRDIVIIEYTDWNSNELRAIINKYGKVIYKGIRSIESHISIRDFDLFVLEINSDHVDGNLYHYHGLRSDELYYLVINVYGEMLIEFTEDYITYDDYEDGFYVGNSEELFKI